MPQLTISNETEMYLTGRFMQDLILHFPELDGARLTPDLEDRIRRLVEESYRNNPLYNNSSPREPMEVVIDCLMIEKKIENNPVYARIRRQGIFEPFSIDITPREITSLLWMLRDNRLPYSQFNNNTTLETIDNFIEKVELKAKARSEGRNLLHGKMSGLLDPSAKRANLIGNNRPAMKKALGMEGFATTVGSFLTNAPRIQRESKGTVDPALRNLRSVAEGNNVMPLRNRGTGVARTNLNYSGLSKVNTSLFKGGLRKRKTRRNYKKNKSLKITRRMKH